MYGNWFIFEITLRLIFESSECVNCKIYLKFLIWSANVFNNNHLQIKFWTIPILLIWDFYQNVC